MAKNANKAVTNAEIAKGDDATKQTQEQLNTPTSQAEQSPANVIDNNITQQVTPSVETVAEKIESSQSDDTLAVIVEPEPTPEPPSILVSVRVVNVPNERRYRGGLCFTAKPTVIDWLSITEEQRHAIATDPHLKKERHVLHDPGSD